MVPVEDNDENYIHPRESSPLPTEKGKQVFGVWRPSSSEPTPGCSAVSPEEIRTDSYSSVTPPPQPFGSGSIWFRALSPLSMVKVLDSGYETPGATIFGCLFHAEWSSKANAHRLASHRVNLETVHHEQIYRGRIK